MLKLLFGKLILAIISVIVIVALILSLVYLNIIKKGVITSTGAFTAMFWFTLITSIIIVLGLTLSVVLDLVYYGSNQSNQWFTISWIVTYGFMIFTAAYLASCAYIFYKASQGSISSTTAGDVFWFGLILTILFAISIITSLILTGVMYSKSKKRIIESKKFDGGFLVMPESLDRETTNISVDSDDSMPKEIDFYDVRANRTDMATNKYQIPGVNFDENRYYEQISSQPVKKPKRLMIDPIRGGLTQTPKSFADNIGVEYKSFDTYAI